MSGVKEFFISIKKGRRDKFLTVGLASLSSKTVLRPSLSRTLPSQAETGHDLGRDNNYTEEIISPFPERSRDLRLGIKGVLPPMYSTICLDNTRDRAADDSRFISRISYSKVIDFTQLPNMNTAAYRVGDSLSRPETCRPRKPLSSGPHRLLSKTVRRKFHSRSLVFGSSLRSRPLLISPLLSCSEKQSRKCCLHDTLKRPRPPCVRISHRPLTRCRASFSVPEADPSGPLHVLP